MSEKSFVSQKSRVPFAVIRVTKFLRQMLSNRLALAGTFFLLLFVFVAVAAPLLTPYSPQGTIVSGNLAAPSWVKYIYGDRGLSQNANFADITASSVGGVTLTPTAQGTDSIDLKVSSTLGGRVLVQESLNYPYSGPPTRFKGSFSIQPVGTTTNAVVNATVSVVRLDSVGRVLQQYPLRTQQVDTSMAASGSIDSQDQSIVQSLGIQGVSTPAQYVFSAPAPYNYVLEMTLPAGFHGEFLVQTFTLQLLGNTWGLLGTDDIGQDIFTQFVYGSRLSLYVGLIATFIGVGMGLVVGLMAGYLGKVVDETLMRFTDMMLVIPALPLLIVLSFVLGPNLNTIVLILGFLGWMGFARLIRSQVLSLRERPFIESAKASGAGTTYILTKHIFPNIIALTYVNLALSVPAAVVGEAALSFLGLGDQNVITWGRMLDLAHSAGSATGLSWWWIIPPGIGIAVLSLSFILIGYSLDELFNPRLRRRR